MLVFPDDTQVGVVGLDDILAELHSEGRKPTDETVDRIISRLEARKNYIPSSERARRDYAYVLLREYRKFVRDQSGSGG